jgi:hypothetical protein
MVVVLPAPFGPRNPVTTPDSVTKLRPLTAAVGPYRLVRSRTSIVFSLVTAAACRSGLTGYGPGAEHPTPSRASASRLDRAVACA